MQRGLQQLQKFFIRRLIASPLQQNQHKFRRCSSVSSGAKTSSGMVLFMKSVNFSMYCDSSEKNLQQEKAVRFFCVITFYPAAPYIEIRRAGGMQYAVKCMVRYFPPSRVRSLKEVFLMARGYGGFGCGGAGGGFIWIIIIIILLLCFCGCGNDDCSSSCSC